MNGMGATRRSSACGGLPVAVHAGSCGGNRRGHGRGRIGRYLDGGGFARAGGKGGGSEVKVDLG